MRQIFNLLLRKLPKAIIYLFCARLFITNIITLCEEYLKFETNVFIKYYTPINVEFPAITVCGCCLKSSVNEGKSVEKIFQEDYVLLHNHSALDIFDNFTYLPKKLLIGCTLTIKGGALKPNKKINISLDNLVVESINQGRKCFTYLFSLPDQESNITGINIDNKRIVKADFWVKIDVFTNSTKELLNSDVIFGIHPVNSYPSFLKVNFLRIYYGLVYTIKFSCFNTRLMKPPYATNCRQYDAIMRPRSQSECINMCILEETIGGQRANNRSSCINYYSFITRKMIMDYPGIKFCLKRNYLEYYRHVLARRKCYSSCKRDCFEKEYYITYDLTLGDGNLAQISIEANHEPVYEIHHLKMITFFETIGFFGGHAHFWLGLSVIQFYDVFEKLFLKIRYHFERFVKFLARKPRNQNYQCT